MRKTDKGRTAMSVEWMGRYEDLVKEMIRHTNITLKGSQIKRNLAGKGIMFTPQMWQVMEYIVEHSQEATNMIQMADTLQIPQSSFSRTVKFLCNEGLVERYHRSSNKKNIILKPTDLAIEIYNENTADMKAANFQNFFDALSVLDDETLSIFVNALKIHNEDLMRYDDVEPDNTLIKIK